MKDNTTELSIKRQVYLSFTKDKKKSKTCLGSFAMTIGEYVIVKKDCSLHNSFHSIDDILETVQYFISNGIEVRYNKKSYKTAKGLLKALNA